MPAAEAGNAGLVLRPTTLVVFGSPAAGTPVMDAAPLAALDLPLKVLVWEDGGRTLVSYVSPGPLRAAGPSSHRCRGHDRSHEMIVETL